jgi:hypothetical protein
MTALFEECLAAQKIAGFEQEDRRTANCPQCGAHGYNTGWGYWAFECGAEALTRSGDIDAPCRMERIRGN